MTGRRKHCYPIVLCAALLVFTGGCSQRWTFAPPGQLNLADRAVVEPAPEQPRLADSRDPRTMPPDEVPPPISVQRVVPTVCQTTQLPANPARFEGFGPAPGGAVAATAVEPVPASAPAASSSDTFFGGEPSEPPLPESAWAWMPEPVIRGYGTFRRAEMDFVARTDCVYARLPEGLTRLRWKALRDQCNFYRWSSGRDLFLGIAGASLLANTSMDQDFRDWVQDDVRDSGTDDFADFWKPFGEGQYIVPAMVGIGLSGWLMEDCPVGNAMGKYGWRASRAYLVGVPPAVFLQWALGSSRPGERWYESSWRPFEDKNAVSGHAFIGAVPFLTAGNMCENPYLAGSFYFMSTLPAWSRINDDSHYLSQSVLGWWIAYMACRSIDQTDDYCESRRLTFAPLCTPGAAGVSAIYEF